MNHIVSLIKLSSNHIKEMQAFMKQTKQNSQTVIQLSIPNLKLLVADQKFLNDIYNCFLNDLIMWLPSPVPPIESALNLFYDAQNNPTIFTTGPNGSSVTSPIQAAPNLNYLIDYNFDTDFIATRMNLANNPLMSGSEEEDVVDMEEKKFHMCRSAILKPSKSESSEESDYCESDSDVTKFKAKKKTRRLSRNDDLAKAKAKEFKNYMSVIVDVEKAHLKAFVLNKVEAKTPVVNLDATGRIFKTDNYIPF